MTSIYARIKPFIRVTPVVEIDGADFGLPDVKLVFKLELLQHTGSFKARGAFANLLLREVPPAGVVAASGGNHGAAVAYAAHRLGVPAKIFVPETAPEAKRELIREYGAELVVGGKTYKEAKEASERERDAMLVHAYDQEETLLGAGTAGLELLMQSQDVDTLLVSVGGGGLIGGVTAELAGSVRVIGVEPERCPTLHDALRAGEPVDAPVGGIAKDSLGATRVGELMFRIARKANTTVVLVSDDDIREAQRKLWKRLRILAEPGAAAAFAALLSRRYVPRDGEKIAILICGGNTDAVDFTRQEK